MVGKRTRGEFFHGRRVVGLAAIRLTVRSNFTKQTGGILVKAATDNTGIIYVGSTDVVTADTVDLTDGFPLSAGDTVVVEIDDPSKIFIIADAADQKVFWIGV